MKKWIIIDSEKCINVELEKFYSQYSLETYEEELIKRTREYIIEFYHKFVLDIFGDDFIEDRENVKLLFRNDDALREEIEELVREHYGISKKSKKKKSDKNVDNQ